MSKVSHQDIIDALAEADAKRKLNAQYGVASTYKPKKVIYDEAAGVTVVLWMERRPSFGPLKARSMMHISGIALLWQRRCMELTAL